jgi:release factor glutamine methyltransferase
MNVYQPAEDSYLLKDYLEKVDLDGKKVLEIGTGTGIVAIAAAKRGAEVTAVDISPEAVETAKENAEDAEVKIKFIKSNLFENVDGEFDLVLFNPPYLPGDRVSERDALVGGQKGTEVIERFAEQVGDFLAAGGEAVFVGSSRSEISEFKDRFDVEAVDSENLWFESLYLFRKT